jgi:hypothetical protein
MATPEDPLRALAERGIMHSEITPTGYNVARARQQAGFPEEGMGVSPMAKAWEDRADTFINELKASDLTSAYPYSIEANPWLLKVPPETRVYDMLRGADEDLGFSHLTDELRNAINPESGLPRELMLKYSDLEKVTVPQAVERVAKINDWRAAQKAEADMARAMNPATFTHKEYPEQGMRWVELRQPEGLPEGFKEVPGTSGERFIGPNGNMYSKEQVAKLGPLEDALRYEGETMGHCVGGYCPDVVEGRSKIYSLRDKKGQPHVTIEVAPRNITVDEAIKMAISEGLPEKGMETFNRVAEIMGSGDFMRQDIVQIKGKGNKAPKEDYLPAVQDFVRSGNFGKVGDLQNTGLYRADEITNFVPESFYATKAEREAAFEKAKAAGKIQDYMTRAEWEDALKSEMPPPTPGPTMEFLKEMGGMPPEGFSQGGQVRGYAAGGMVSGANFHTGDFDPARIGSIVDELHALNAG